MEPRQSQQFRTNCYLPSFMLQHTIFTTVMTLYFTLPQSHMFANAGETYLFQPHHYGPSLFLHFPLVALNSFAPSTGSHVPALALCTYTWISEIPHGIGTKRHIASAGKIWKMSCDLFCPMRTGGRRSNFSPTPGLLFLPSSPIPPA